MFKHILQVLPALDSGGVEQGTLELAEFLSQQGLCSSVASSGGQLVERLSDYGVEHFNAPLNSKNPIQIIRNAQWLKTLVLAHNIDLIHVRSRAPAWSVYLASKATGVPYLSTFHGYYGHRNALKRAYNSAMLRGKACIAVSGFIKSHIHETYPWARNIVQINRGVDCNVYCPEANASTSNSPFTLLMPGRFSELKNHDLLLDALEDIPSDSVKVIFVGSSTGKEHYVDQLRKRASKLPHEIEFIEQHRDLRPLYALADAVVSATRKPESFGRTVIEAQAMQCLVLAPDHGANQTIIAPELQLGLFTANDSQSLAHKILTLKALHDEKRRALGRTARAFVQSHFERAQMTQKTLELYQQLWQDSAKLHGR